MRRIVLGAVVALVVAACAAAEPRPIAIVANAHHVGVLGVGEQRVLVGLVEAEGNRFLAQPDRDVRIDFFFGDDPDAVVGTVDGEFLWTVPDVRGLYRTSFTFDRPGTWGLVVHAEGLPESEVSLFSVVPESSLPDVGDVAPAAQTPTAIEHRLAEITTDPDPDPRFYESSLDDALSSGRPSVIVFATPRFCTSATCGPTLDIVKSVAPSFPDVNFVHVEIYEITEASSFEELVVVPAVTAWRLPSEPWVFVTNAAGTIDARFEGSVAPEELAAALAALG